MELTTRGSGDNQSIYHHYCHSSSFQSNYSDTLSIRQVHDEELELKWAAIEKLPTFKRLRTSLFDVNLNDGDGTESQEKRLIDVTKINELERHLFIGKLLNHIEHDNFRFLQKLRERIDRVGVKLPTVEVRYENLYVEAECEVVQENASSNLWNSISTLLFAIKKGILCKSQKANISILKDVSGVIKPSRLTLLLGPPGCGKTTLLLALAGHANHFLKVAGEITYNGYMLDEFVPQKTSAYISQHDLHIAEMTVKETIDFSARCQGVGSREEIMKEVSKREKEAGIVPDTEIDTFMKATAVKGQRSTLQTDYILKVLGLDMSANIMVGDAMQRGISGGQKKRLTTGEMIVGPTKALFMDEISTGLDTSTTFQIMSYIQQLVHTTDATALVSLLQPAPETFELFDDLILMTEGKIVYHGPGSSALQYFENIGFKCPERKGVADFLQEVISKRDQEQFWCRNDLTYSYISVDQFCMIFKASSLGKEMNEELSRPYDRSQSHKNALCFSKHSLSKWELFKACMSKEFLLMKRSSFVYIFKTTQLIIIAIITMTIFIRTRMTVDLQHSEYFMGVLFYTVIRLMTNGVAEVTFTCLRLPVFYKQRSIHLYPVWAYCIPASIIKIPFSLLESLLWTSITYYVIGYTPEVERFVRQFILLFALHLSSTSLCRFIASVFQTMVAANSCGSMMLVMMFLFGGFLLPRESLPAWLRWGFWTSLMSYGEIGISVNEFLAPRWQKVSIGNTTLGHHVLASHGLDFADYYYWISVGALVGLMILFDLGFILALTYLKSPGISKAVISNEKLSQLRGTEDSKNSAPNFHTKCNTEKRNVGNVVLPFQPITMRFKDVQYFVETPPEMREHDSGQNKLQLLQDMTGVFRPGILTALMGVSGAGKTTLMDILSGRKTGGIIEGEIRIRGYSKVQETFARISGYCEQNDIHSPYITVEESITFSAWLRLPSQIDPEVRARFVEGVIEIIELDDIRDSIVGIPGQSGLSTEQRKRLTIAVELVSNPAIIFMDEPTSGLNARSAAIVMRTVKNIVATGRTTVCTIHQPSIDIFEAFDELILMKRGGQIIYSGMLGHHSSKLLEYFEGIRGLPNIKDNYNPATWMLEVTSSSVEEELGLDFADIYKKSRLYQDTIELVRELREPTPMSQDLELSSKFAQNSWGQYVACLWKQNLLYSRNPQYNSTRFTFVIVASVLFGAVFWQKGQKINSEQDLFNMLGLMFVSVISLGGNICTAIIPCVALERNVLYRERFAAMYSPWAYSLAQVTIEIPYILLQAILYVAITYPSIGYHWSAHKVFWYMYATFCTFLYFVYLGMLIVSLSSSLLAASILSTAVYTILSLFSGFLMPGPKIPGWWIWLYRICPTSWSLYGLLSSQYGDLDKKIEIFGELKSVSSFLEDFFGFRHDYLGLVAVILIAFPIIFAFLFAYCITRLNFQRR